MIIRYAYDYCYTTRSRSTPRLCNIRVRAVIFQNLFRARAPFVRVRVPFVLDDRARSHASANIVCASGRVFASYS